MRILGENAGSPEFALYEGFIDRLYESFSSGDSLDNLATNRGSAEYIRILGLQQVPIAAGSLVLDIAVGRSRYEADDFGVPNLRVVKADIDPKSPDVEKRNVLKIEDPNEKYDELWALHLMRYIDFLLPPPIRERIDIACQRLGLTFSVVYENLLTAFGLMAFREMLRVIKPDGRVRLGGYYHHFQQGKLIPEFLRSFSEGALKGVSLSGIDIYDPKEQGNIFFAKTTDYIQEDVDACVIKRLKELIPSGILNFSWS